MSAILGITSCTYRANKTPNLSLKLCPSLFLVTTGDKILMFLLRIWKPPIFIEKGVWL